MHENGSYVDAIVFCLTGSKRQVALSRTIDNRPP
jgi:hypothetical protein